MEVKNELKYWESYFQSLQMTYYALLAGPLFFFAIIFLRAENGNETFFNLPEQYTNTLVGLVVIFALIVLVYLHFATRIKYRVAASEKDIIPKMQKYRSATLIKYVGLAIFQLVTVVVFSMTYHNGLMALFTGLLLYSSFFRPELQTVRRDLRLSKEDYSKINYKA